MPVIACKLPAGLKIHHEGKTLTLHGANIGERLNSVSPNGDPSNNEHRSYGFGLTELNEQDAEAFKNWAKAVTEDGNGGKLREPFPALENGAILGPFKTRDEAHREIAALHGAIHTGFEGLDPEKEAGIETDEDAGGDDKPAKRSRAKN